MTKADVLYWVTAGDYFLAGCNLILGALMQTQRDYWRAWVCFIGMSCCLLAASL